MLSLISVSGNIGLGSIVSALAALAAAWIARGNRRETREVKETTHRINTAVNDVSPGEKSINETVKKISDSQDDIAAALVEKENGA